MTAWEEIMDYEKILAKEVERMVDGNGSSWDPSLEDIAWRSSVVFGNRDHLSTHVPGEEDVVKVFQEMAYANDDHSVKLVPLRPYLQVRLMVPPERLDELVANNPWLGAWMGYIRALQEVKILEIFGGGNIDDGRMKWLLWSVLGESVDITAGRPETAMGTESILKDLNDGNY
jgi:hypothetical protein